MCSEGNVVAFNCLVRTLFELWKTTYDDIIGDTMNTAARMEHNGVRDKIQLSQETADLLIEAGKSNWLERREDLVNAKGT